MRYARIIMSARTLSRVACWTSASETEAPFSLAFALIFWPTAFSTWAQFPSSAETSSPFA